ncbi:MAG TPA: MoxR family ATPase [Alphaproteobacteria bacterium]|nr:MoxR family ATPase [Alphaproteobacteria bacterium]
MTVLDSYKKGSPNRELDNTVKQYQKQFLEIKNELGKVIVGQSDIVDAMILGLICNGHILVEGVPGIAKTLTVRTLASITNSQFSRIQFTPDLLPTDIIGITTYEEGRGFYSVKGPIFANFVLADEINRAPPKVQSALLEAMQERQVTIGKESFALPVPFFVMATQNPIESLGTYKLPEAQIDRFLFKLQMKYPTPEEELKIMHQNSTLRKFEDFNLKTVFTTEQIVLAQQDVKKIFMDKKVEKYIVGIVEATRNPQKYNIGTGKYIDYGTSPRSTIALFIASKAYALLNGKSFVTPMHVKAIAHNVLRHRILLNYEGQADEISTDKIIDEILRRVPVP